MALYPALIASIVASFTSHALGLEKFAVPLKENVELDTRDLDQSCSSWLGVCLAGKLLQLAFPG